MHTHYLSVPRTARYHALGPSDGGAREVWVVCHGYGQLAAQFLEGFRPLDDGTRLVVAPEALSRFYLDDQPGTIHTDSRVGATWMTREDREHEIADYVRYLDTLHDELLRSVERDRVRLVALGFSQGVATVTRWATLGTARPDRLVLWAGSLPQDLDEDAARRALGRLRVTLVVGSRDRFATPEVVGRQQEWLRERGIPFEHVSYDGGHRIDGATLARLAGG